jgi:hypothetical protein
MSSASGIGTPSGPPTTHGVSDQIIRFWRYIKVNDEESLQEFITAINTVNKYIVNIFADAEGSNGHRRSFKVNIVQVKMVSLRRS